MLPQLVAAFGLVVGGLWLAGDQLLALVSSQPISGFYLGAGLVLAVVGVVFGGFILRRLEATSPTVEED